MLLNIDDRFPHNVLSILDAFSIFNLDTFHRIQLQVSLVYMATVK